jgi:hypothetical protein
MDDHFLLLPYQSVSDPITYNIASYNTKRQSIQYRTIITKKSPINIKYIQGVCFIKPQNMASGTFTNLIGKHGLQEKYIVYL